jgi:hypothetical protein
MAMVSKELQGDNISDPDFAPLLNGRHYLARWRIFPYGWWDEGDGRVVIFDRKYRPICRRYPDRRVEIVASNQEIKFVGQTWLYGTDGSHPCDDRRARERVLGVVRRLGLVDELRHRRRLESRGRLLEWNRQPAPAKRQD